MWAKPTMYTYIPYPGGNNGKPIFALWTIRPTLLVLAPLTPHFNVGGKVCQTAPERKTSRSTLKWGARGARGRGEALESNRNESAAHPVSQKVVSRYFRPGMDPKICKHPFYTARSVTEVVTNIAS